MPDHQRGVYLFSCEDCGSLGRYDDRDEDEFPEPWAKEEAIERVDEHPDDHDCDYERIDS